MQKLWKQIGSPRHLVVFEAAARLGSFTRAARELNVQQPAISASIKRLEDSLGVTLFHRRHKMISLTISGERLLADVTRAFEQLSHSVLSIQQLETSNYVTLNASTAFNNYWIMPRLAAFQRLHPQIDLRLQSSDREPDIAAEQINLAVRRGSGQWADCESALIAPEMICPVSSPRTMAAAVNLRSLPSLLHQRLIHLEEPIRERPSWRDWFTNFDIHDPTPEAGLRLNDYALVLQAAMAGEGFAFGWRHLTDPLVEQGLLADRKDWSWSTGKGFYLVWSKTQPLSDEVHLVKDWILNEAALSPHPAP